MHWQHAISWSASQSNLWETPFCNDYYLQRNIPCYHPSSELLPAAKDRKSPLISFPLANNLFLTFFPKSRNPERLISAQPTDRSLVGELIESGLRNSPSELMPSDFERLYLIELSRNKTLEEDQKCLKDVLEKLKSDKLSQKQEYEQFIRQLENEVQFYKGFESRYQDAVTKCQNAEQELTRKTAQIDRLKQEGQTVESEEITNELRARLKRLHQEKMSLLDNMVISRNQITELNNKIYLSKKAQEDPKNFNDAAELPKINTSNRVHLENVYIKKISNPESLNKPIEVRGGVLPDGETVNEFMIPAKPRRDVNKHSPMPDSELMDSIRNKIDVQKFQPNNKPSLFIDPFNSFENSPRIKDSLRSPKKQQNTNTVIVDTSNPNDMLNNSEHENILNNPFAAPRNNRAYRDQPNIESDPRTSIDNETNGQPTSSSNFFQKHPEFLSNDRNNGQGAPQNFNSNPYRRPSAQNFSDQPLTYNYGTNNPAYPRPQANARVQSPAPRDYNPQVSQNYSYQYSTDRPVSSPNKVADNSYPATSTTRLSPAQITYTTRRIGSPTRVIVKDPVVLPERRSIVSVTDSYPLRTSITRRTVSPLPVTTIIHEPKCPNCSQSMTNGRISRSRDGTSSISLKEPIRTTLTRVSTLPLEPLNRSITELPPRYNTNTVTTTSYSALPANYYSTISNNAPERTSIHKIIETNPPRISYKSGISIDHPAVSSTTKTRVVHSPIHQRTYSRSPSADRNFKANNTKVYKISHDNIPLSQSEVPLSYSKNQTDFKKQSQPEIVTPIRYTSHVYVPSSSVKDPISYTSYQNQNVPFNGQKSQILAKSSFAPDYPREYNSLAQSLDMTNNYQSRIYDRVDSYRNSDHYNSIPRRTSLIMDYYPPTAQTLESNQYRYT